MDITNAYWTNRGWQSVILNTDTHISRRYILARYLQMDDDEIPLSTRHPHSQMSDEELTLEDDGDDDNFDRIEEVVESIEDLFDILEDLLDEGDDIYIGTIPIFGEEKKEPKETTEKTKDDAYDRAMKGL